MNKKSNIITVRFNDKAHQRLREVATNTGVSISDLIRICVQGELPKIEEKYVGAGTNRNDN